MLSFIIPAYNEERCLARTLQSLDAAAREVGEPFEVIVVNDASTDRTAAIAREHGARVIDFPFHVLAVGLGIPAPARRTTPMSRLAFLPPGATS